MRTTTSSNRQQKKRSVLAELVIIIALAAVTLILASIFRLHERYDQWIAHTTRPFPPAHEVLMVVAVLMFLFAIFSLRRWYDLRREMRLRLLAEAQTGAYRDHLEELAQKRAGEIAVLHKQIEFILGATNTGLDIIDAAYNIVYIDPSWAKVYGDPRGKKCYEYFMNRTTRCPQCGVARAFETKRPVVTEEILVKENNRPVQVTTMPYQDKEGNWLVAEVNVDITERKRIEQELAESQRKIRALLDQTFQFIGLLSPDGIVLDVNRAALDFVGVTPANVLHKPFWDTPWWTHSPALQAALRQAIEKAARHGIFIRFETTHLDKNGALHYIDFSIKPVKDEAGHVTFLIPEGRDITEYKTQEETLSRYRDHLEAVIKERSEQLVVSEAQYRRLFETAQDGILLLQAETGSVIDVNPALATMIGCSRSEIVDKKLWEVGPLQNIVTSADEFVTLQTRGYFHQEGMPLVTKGGQHKEVEFTCIVYQADHTRIVQCSIRDITDRRRAEAALEMSEANYRSIFEMASDAIIICDLANYAIVDANKAACTMFCYPHKEMAGLALRALADTEAPYTWDELQLLCKKAEAGEQQLFEWSVRDKAGRSFWAEANMRRAIIGARYRLLFIVRDVTERKRVASLKDDFMNTVSHELRTPLAAIKEGIALIADEAKAALTENGCACLDIAKRNVDRLSRFINNILDFQKLSSGKMVFDLKPHDINAVVKECHATMVPLAHEKKLELSLELGHDIPPIVFDRDMITQVLINLISNAIKFTNRGHVIIKTMMRDNAVTISVRDTGIGIKESDLPRLFGKFEQIRSDEQLRTGGTGLGLPIAKEIIERHRGRIWAESTHGSGSTFCFVLPVMERRR